MHRGSWFRDQYFFLVSFFHPKHHLGNKDETIRVMLVAWGLDMENWNPPKGKKDKVQDCRVRVVASVAVLLGVFSAAVFVAAIFPQPSLHRLFPQP